VELEFLVVFIFLGFGLCARAVFGLNFWTLLCSMALVMLVLPLFLTPELTEVAITLSAGDAAAKYLDNFREWLPSMLVGTLAGIFTREVLCLPRVIIDFVRNLF